MLVNYKILYFTNFSKWLWMCQNVYKYIIWQKILQFTQTDIVLTSVCAKFMIFCQIIKALKTNLVNMAKTWHRSRQLLKVKMLYKARWENLRTEERLVKLQPSRQHSCHCSVSSRLRQDRSTCVQWWRQSHTLTHSCVTTSPAAISTPPW